MKYPAIFSAIVVMLLGEVYSGADVSSNSSSTFIPETPPQTDETQPESAPQSTSVDPTTRTPPQVSCLTLQAENRSTVIASVPQVVGNWMLRRVTEMPSNVYYERFGKDQNFCNIFHYGPDCGTVAFHRMTPDNITISYNESTRDFLFTYSKSHSTDPHYMVEREKIDYMEHFDIIEDKIERVDQIPETVKTEFESEFAVLAVASHGGWSILKTCDEKVTWVKLLVPLDYPDGEAEKQTVATYDEEINIKLDELGIQRSSLKIVPVHLQTGIISNN